MLVIFKDVAIYENNAYFLHGGDKAIISLVALDLNTRLDQLKGRNDWNSCVALLASHQYLRTPETMSDVRLPLSLLTHQMHNQLQEPGNEENLRIIENLIQIHAQQRQEMELQKAQSETEVVASALSMIRDAIISPMEVSKAEPSTPEVGIAGSLQAASPEAPLKGPSSFEPEANPRIRDLIASDVGSSATSSDFDSSPSSPSVSIEPRC